MSDYPRQAISGYKAGFVPDRAFAAFRLAVSLYGSLAYFNAFRTRWEWMSPGTSIFVWAPPLGTHLSTQILGTFHIAFVSAGLWYGRGWAFAYTMVTGLIGCALALLAYHSAPALVFAGLTALPTFLYCALRLVGAIGSSVGGLELRRPFPAGDPTKALR